MKKNSIIKSLFSLSLLLFFGCFKTEYDRKTHIIFGTSGEYPPFEFYQNGELVGFDIDLGKALAKELNKKAIFEDIPFETILVSLTNNTIDAGISTLTITEERKQIYDCSIPYYQEQIALVYLKEKPFKTTNELYQKIVGAQLGSAQEIWLKKNNQSAIIITMNNNNQLIEALKSRQLNAVIIDQSQAKAFCKKNESLDFSLLENSGEPYGIILKKNSPLLHDINKILEKFKTDGTLDALIKKWLLK